MRSKKILTHRLSLVTFFLGHDVNRHGSRDLAVQAHRNLKFAQLLEGVFHLNLAPVNLIARSFESFGHVERRDGAEERSGFPAFRAIETVTLASSFASCSASPFSLASRRTAATFICSTALRLPAFAGIASFFGSKKFRP